MRPAEGLYLGLAILCLGTFAARSSTPEEPGPFSVAELREDLIDPSRDREIDLLLLYPVGTEGTRVLAGRFPLIVFNHGFLLRGDLYRSYGEQLASHGFVVALPTYPMSLFALDHAELAVDVERVIDHCLALDGDARNTLHGLVDESRVGAAGHSLGGKLALLEATNDARVDAIATLDPVDGGGPGTEDPVLSPSVAPELMSEIEVPLLFIGAELGSLVSFLVACAPEPENYRRFYAAANSPAIEITQLGVGHGQYVDPGAEAMMAACAPGTAPSDWVRTSSAAYLTAFFLWQLRGEDSARSWLDARLAEDEGLGLIVVRRK